MHRSIAIFVWLIALIGSAPVYAQSVATFVSGNGNDSDDCLTPDTACRQISAALAKTLAYGTIHVLPGSYLNINVTESVNIVAQGEASIKLDGVSAHAINVNTGVGDVVRVSGFLVHGEVQGISFVGTGTLHIEHCTLVEPNNRFAVDFQPTGASELYMTDTTVSGGAGGGYGIIINPSGSASVKAVFDLIRVTDGGIGLSVEGSVTTGTVSVTLRNTVIGASSIGVGVRDESATGATNVMIEESLITGHITGGGYGVVSVGVNSTVRMRDSTVRQGYRGIQTGNGGKIFSHGGNVIVDNQINGSFTATLPPQ